MMNRSASCSSAGPERSAISTTIIIGFLLALPACGVPKLRKPKCAPPLPDTFNGALDYENSAQLGWCEFFDDPHLTGLIGQALAGNQELRILNEDIRIANNEILAARGAYLPFVSFGSRAGIDKASRFTREGAVEDQLDVAPGKPFPEPLPDFLLAANVSWEIDIWRKLRNARDAASLRYLGTAEGRNYTVTRLVAEVAENYYELLALDNRLATLDQMIVIQEQSLQSAEAMKQAARGTELAVQRFEAEVRKNQSERNIIQQEIIETENQINFLLGRFPQPVDRNSAGFIDLHLQALRTGVPAQLLQNRADIRQAERELAAAGLDVRVARANFYPSINISAGVGYRAFNTRYLFTSPDSLIYNVGGDLIAPLINKKAIQAEYMTANAMQLQAAYNYQRVVLNAFTEVINRLAKVENYGRSIELKRQQLTSLEASVGNATQLFQNARVDYMEVLLAQRDLLEARMVIIVTKQQQLAAIVNAYQALGGGAALYGSGVVLTNPMALPPVIEEQTEEVPPPAPLETPQPDLPPDDAEPAPGPGATEVGLTRIRLLPATPSARLHRRIESPQFFQGSSLPSRAQLDGAILS